MAGLGAEVSWVATVFRVCARRLCLAVVPVGGARSAGSGCGACGRRRGLAGLRDRPLRAKLVCGDLAGGPPPTGATGRIKWAGCGGWRAVRGLRGLVVVPVGGGGAWPDHSQRREGGARPAGPACGACLRCLWAAVGPGRTTPSDERAARGLRGLAGLRDDAPSEARGADGERAGRPRAARKCGGGAAARNRGGEGAARKRGRQEFSVRRRRSRRGRLRNRSRMGRYGPGGSRGRSRRLRRLRRCRGRGRGRRRRRPGRV